MIRPRRDDEQPYEEPHDEPGDAAGQSRQPGDTPLRLVDDPRKRLEQTGAGGPGVQEGSSASLVPQEEAARFLTEWNRIQSRFVDDPRGTVQEADALVAEMIKQVTELFADERSETQRRWSGGDNVSTEDLRLAMRRYRSFFDRLLSQ